MASNFAEPTESPSRKQSSLNGVKIIDKGKSLNGDNVSIKNADCMSVSWFYIFCYKKYNECNIIIVLK